MDRSDEPFDAHINGSPAKNSDSTSFFSHVAGLEEVSGEVADIDARERMNFAINPVLGKTSKVCGFAALDRQHSGQPQFRLRPRYLSGRVDGSL